MPARFLEHPFRLGSHGGVAVTADRDQHVRDLIEAVLFTTPGERLNRPDFGVGIDRAVFETIDPLSAAALQVHVAHGLTRALGGLIELEAVEVHPLAAAGEIVLEITWRHRRETQTQVLAVRR